MMNVWEELIAKVQAGTVAVEDATDSEAPSETAPDNVTPLERAANDNDGADVTAIGADPFAASS